MTLKRKTGEYRIISTTGEKCQAFIPYPLPPDPPLHLGGGIIDLEDRAIQALGRLDSVSTLLPDTSLFLYMYIRKEAVLSSQIEGTQSSLSDLLLFESESIPGVPLNDVQEVSNYVAAINHGIQRIREGFPISLRLIKEIHNVLLSKGRGSDKQPGEFRTSQNWIGGSRPGDALFVPPPADEILNCMGALEDFLHDKPEKTPILIKAALSHAQFETIHPFLDGNGRLGRLLITLLLCAERYLTDPLLYLSLYFKTHRVSYYDHLQAIRRTGDWESWISFFVTGIKETAEQAVQNAQNLVRLFDEDYKKIQSIGKAAGSAMRVHLELQHKPIISIPDVCERTGLTYPTVKSSFDKLSGLGITELHPQKRKPRLYVYARYLEVLNQGTETI